LYSGTYSLSASGNPNFSLLLPNPGNRSQCLKYCQLAYGGYGWDSTHEMIMIMGNIYKQLHIDLDVLLTLALPGLETDKESRLRTTSVFVAGLDWVATTCYHEGNV
jgi:hypothetical protein